MNVQPESLVTIGGKRPKKRLSTAQRKKRRQKQKMAAGGVFFLLIVFIWYGLQPITATIEYGICRTLAEMKSHNNMTMKVISYENYGPAWKIFYTFTGQYGEQRSNYIDCVFTRDPQGNLILKNAKINRDPLSKDALDRFNKSIPGVIAANPSLNVPTRLEETDIKGLRTIIDTGVED